MSLSAPAHALFENDLNRIHVRTDRMFSWLLLGQWAFAVLMALVWSPRTWIASYWTLHQHLIAAVLLGGFFASYPLYLIRRQPGSAYTRHMIAIGQMLQSALLVHVTGGRIETHFHVFGSLALLAFYRDWRVLLTATAVVYADHLALGAWFPLSVYGVQSATIWRSLEHAAWVIFEIVFLTMSCRKGIEELQMIAKRQTEIEGMANQLKKTNETLEEKVSERTADLSKANEELTSHIARRKQAEDDLARKVAELETINDAMMGREERILELKQEINQLLQQLQQAPRYQV